MTNLSASNKTFVGLCVLAFLAAAAWSFQSGWRWTHFQYTTFDLAFYVQALDGFSHGRNWSSLLGVQPFGNHADFIILLLWPVYAIFHHPLTLVVLQNLALAGSLPLGWAVAREFGWSPQRAFWLALVLLLNPVLTFVALHEFHPEAFAAPLWLAIYLAWQRKDQRLFWISLILFLSCKENLGLVCGTWFLVEFVRQPTRRNLWKWNLWPGVVTGLWMGLYLFWLGPKWNAGNVDFGALYSHLHEKGIFAGAIGNLRQSLQGNMIWALLLPMLLLPLRKPLALLPAVPILLQHLLSWRSSEWSIYYHYAAPLLPVFWIATLEAWPSARDNGKKWFLAIPTLLAVSNVVCFLEVGAPQHYLDPFFVKDPNIDAKRQIVQSIPADTSVLAPLPFLSHLAQRPKIYSLHLVTKGLKTLSRQIYSPPPPTDFVIVNYEDPVTFDAFSGYYHPAMKLKTGEVVPSSDVLLHRFLARATWRVESAGSLTVWTKTSEPRAPVSLSIKVLKTGVIDPETDLVQIFAFNNNGQIQIVSDWKYRSERRKVPWMQVVAVNKTSGEKQIFTRGLCCPEGRADGSIWRDEWNLPPDFSVLADEWDLMGLFEDHATRIFSGKAAGGVPPVIIGIPWRS